MMSPILTLLNTSAVPFQYPTEYPSSKQRGRESLSERRRQRVLPSIIVPQDSELQNLGVSLESNHNQFDAINQRDLMAAVLNEAVKTIEYVVGPNDVQVTSREAEQSDISTSASQNNCNQAHSRSSTCPRTYDTPRAPPNSPSSNQTATFFDFSSNCIDHASDDEVKASTSQQQLYDIQPTRLSRTRSMRKRRRKSSFKDPSVQPRVSPKIPQFEHAMTSNNDADDEGSDEEVVRATRKKTMAKSPSKHCHKIISYHHRLNDTGLEFGLELVAETQKLSSSSSSDSEQTDGRKSKMTDWSKVGEELRSIADSFQDSNGGANFRVEATLTGEIPRDIYALLNMMLPISIPQSLWSALVSYAAWKIFKRFQ